MLSAWFISIILLATPPIPCEATFVQVHPANVPDGISVKSPNRTRAAVLIHGIRAHSFQESKIAKATLHSWQRSDSTLVKSLSAEADVFSFAYGQNVGVDDVAASVALKQGIEKLRDLSYAEIILVGHSAGGLVARYFVEDFPDAGVTKVIQLCSPNGGSTLGYATAAVRLPQEVFLQSLTRSARLERIKRLENRKIPDKVEFVCVMGTAAVIGDGVLTCQRQWSDDLQEQGIPVVSLATTHFQPVRSKSDIAVVVRLMKESHPRWKPEQVTSARQKMVRIEAIP